jgi:hypothetical protein
VKRFPWGRFWLTIAALAALVLAVGFVLKVLGVW